MFTVKERVKPLQILTLTEGKAHLNVTEDDDDDLIRAYISSISEMIESKTNRLFSECVVTAEFTLSRFESTLFIPFGNVASMTSVQVDGTDINYTYSAVSQQLCIPVQSITLPATVTVTFTAGTAPVPAPIKHAAMIWLSDAFEYRENKIEGQYTSAPLAANMLISNYHIPASIQNG